MASANKMRLKTELERLAAQLSVANPGWIAEQIMLLVNGAYASGSIDPRSVSGERLKSAAAAIIRAGRTGVKTTES